MTVSTELIQKFGVVQANPVGLDLQVTEPMCEGLNVLLASFQSLYIQYQKHHFVVEGAEFYQIHDFFQECFEKTQSHCHDLGERLNGLGGVPVSSFVRLAEYCCFTPESDDIFGSRAMIEHDLTAEQSVIAVIRRQIGQAESMGDMATRHMLESILLETEERAYHLQHFLANDSLVRL